RGRGVEPEDTGLMGGGEDLRTQECQPPAGSSLPALAERPPAFGSVRGSPQLPAEGALAGLARAAHGHAGPEERAHSLLLDLEHPHVLSLQSLDAAEAAGRGPLARQEDAARGLCRD